ncbi:hypothetical protein THTE_2241 [Thermogutta terrifontis]|uniref:Uncharacterized protein n=1 Tax=Thermogutta terrifontis TaxID=1331910 RepID=A0A286RFW2_9BACT|nr:hypothetical protein THTE_2241 [Thermogutta terrifontis]
MCPLVISTFDRNFLHDRLILTRAKVTGSGLMAMEGANRNRPGQF